MKKCKDCRKRKRNMDATPKRPPRGSIRKAKRDEMRAQKKRRMAEAKAQVEAQAKAKVEAETVESTVHEVSVEDSMRGVEGTSNISIDPAV